MAMRLLYLIVVFLIVASDAAATESTKKVGVILPLSGSAATYGEQFRKGLEISPSLAEFELIYEDSKFENTSALTAYQKLTKVDRVDYLISFGGATCEVLNSAAQRDRIVHIAAGCNTAKFNSSDSFSFRLDVNEEVAAAKTADYLKGEGVRRIAFLYVQNSWAESIIKFTREAVERASVEVTDDIAFTENSAGDLRSHLARLKANSPQRLFIISLPNLTPLILRQLRNLEITIPVVSNISVENPEVVRLAGADANGITYLSVRPSPESRSEHASFFRVFPDGNPFAAWGYDSILLLSRARRAAEPRKELQSLNDFIGAFNRYNFDVQGELSLPYEIRAIDNGQYVTRKVL